MQLTPRQATHHKCGVGTRQWFTKIDDYITYLMVRIDFDKVTPH